VRKEEMHLCCPYQVTSTDRYDRVMILITVVLTVPEPYLTPFQAQDRRRVASVLLSLPQLLRSPTVSRPTLLLYYHTPQGYDAPSMVENKEEKKLKRFLCLICLNN